MYHLTRINDHTYTRAETWQTVLAEERKTATTGYHSLWTVREVRNYTRPVKCTILSMYSMRLTKVPVLQQYQTVLHQYFEGTSVVLIRSI